MWHFIVQRLSDGGSLGCLEEPAQLFNPLSRLLNVHLRPHTATGLQQRPMPVVYAAAPHHIVRPRPARKPVRSCVTCRPTICSHHCTSIENVVALIALKKMRPASMQRTALRTQNVEVALCLQCQTCHSKSRIELRRNLINASERGQSHGKTDE